QFGVRFPVGTPKQNGRQVVTVLFYDKDYLLLLRLFVFRINAKKRKTAGYVPRRFAFFVSGVVRRFANNL
ncbi:MAG: hypothetical protein IKD03_02225, partial [Clostridia bacterium]|nr:hypothetical protein [Clostridia bacterium]